MMYLGTGSQPQASVSCRAIHSAVGCAVTPNHNIWRRPCFTQEIAERVAKALQRWTMVVTVADPGDPTADPSKAWPPGRRAVEVGALVVQRIEGERNGPCREINFDPTILPNGVHVSDDPFPAARSAAYARSYDLRTSELKYYPYHSEAAGGGER